MITPFASSTSCPTRSASRCTARSRPNASCPTRGCAVWCCTAAAQAAGYSGGRRSTIGSCCRWRSPLA
eukprot:2927848-Prymnesium_polylepis.1